MSESFCYLLTFRLLISQYVWYVVNIHLQCVNKTHIKHFAQIVNLYAQSTNSYAKKIDAKKKMETPQRKQPKLNCNAMRRFTKCVSNSYRIFIKKIKVGKKMWRMLRWMNPSLHLNEKLVIKFTHPHTSLCVCAGKGPFALARVCACVSVFECVESYFLFAPPFSPLDFANKNINKNELHPNVYMLHGYGYGYIYSTFFGSFFFMKIWHRNVCMHSMLSIFGFSFRSIFFFFFKKYFTQSRNSSARFCEYFCSALLVRCCAFNCTNN